MEKSITRIREIISKLPKSKQSLLEEIFFISVFDSEVRIPKPAEKYLKKRFGELSRLKNQRIVRVDNLLTRESTLFNSIRASRPIPKSIEKINLDKKDDFCEPYKVTPIDPFGRITGRYNITSANVAKYDCYHDLIIFKKHNPLKFSKESISEAIDIALRWFTRINHLDARAVYPFLIWNCLWRSGSSVVHGHMQMTLTKERHYPHIEALREAFYQHNFRHNRDYFDDFYDLHESLGLGFKYKGIRIISHLVPVKEKEIILICKEINSSFKDVLYRVLKCFTSRLGVESFNLALMMKPFCAGWGDFPVIVRIVDRGSLQSKSSDLGAMELYSGSSVVASDPFVVARKLKQEFSRK